MIIKHKADLECADDKGLTALHYAAMFRYERLVELLIKSGANVSKQDKEGNTAIYYAADNNLKCNFFNSLGGSIMNVRNKNGNSALH